MARSHSIALVPSLPVQLTATIVPLLLYANADQPQSHSRPIDVPDVHCPESHPYDTVLAVEPHDTCSGSANIVLIVEDSVVNQKVAMDLLRRLGYISEIAADGLDALQYLNLHRDRVALILMDIQMPNLDGHGACERLRAMGCQLPIVAMSANALEQDKQNARAVGMNGFIEKPLDKVVFKKYVKHFFGKLVMTNEYWEPSARKRRMGKRRVD